MLRATPFTVMADAPSVWVSNRCPNLELPKSKTWGVPQEDICEPPWGPPTGGHPLF